MSKTIVKAAIKVKDEIFTGFDHGECFKFARDKFPIPVEDLEQGFIDSDGNFVDRKQAMIIAKEAGQLRYEPSKKTLISEDLHIDWLNKQKQIINDLEKEQIVEMKEHQEAMQVADQRIKELQDQLALTEKALELACEDMDCEDCPLNETICDSWRGVEDGCAKAIAKCYLKEAKEMMESE